MSTYQAQLHDQTARNSLAEERKKASFDVRQLTYALYCSKERTEALERALLRIQRDPVLNNSKSFYDLSRPEARRRSMAQIRRLSAIRASLQNNPEELAALTSAITMYDRTLAMRFYVHDTLFRESIYLQGSAEQWEKWRLPVMKMQVIGCYAMTEMGHSSHLRGLETTATFDRSTQEFVIHSPTLTATKWWIGMAGQVATHTVALCQLLIDKKEYGLFWFIVPLRNPENGELMPGITAGDIGSKVSRQGLDNGWIQFTFCRVPRENMLMKWAQVSADGVFTAASNPSISYASLIGERLVAAYDVFEGIAQGLTIAVRYASVRRQGSKDQKILDYQTHYARLLPHIATDYALGFVSRRILVDWLELQKSSEGKEEMFLAQLPFFHANAAGIKAWFGWWGAEALETIRRSIGGHAYSAYNAIGSLTTDFWVVTTGGGDNVVLAQQHARYVLGAFRKAAQGKKMPNELQHLANAQTYLSQQNSRLRISKEEDLASFDVVVEALKWLQVTMLAKIGQELQATVESGVAPNDAWNEHLLQLLDCSRVSCYLFVLERFVAVVANTQQSNLQSILRQLCELFGLSILEREMLHLMQLGYVDANQSALVRRRHLALCKLLRNQAVPLTDAFNHPDFVLKAPIARFDGDIYNAYFETVMNAPNVLDRPDYWHDEVAPLIRPRL